jgi:hypothetical protein
VDDGHQGQLMGVRAAVWLTYLRHADATACACPSNDTLARAAGHSQSRHVREARVELVRLGYLVDTGRIHPKYKTPIYRLTLPRIGAPCPESGHGAPIPPETLPLIGAPNS